MFRSYHKNIVDEAKPLLRNALNDAQYVTPTITLTSAKARSIAAGSLTIGNDDKHFTVQPFKEFTNREDVVLKGSTRNHLQNFDLFMSHFEEPMTESKAEVKTRRHVFDECKCNIMKKSGGDLRSESELRYIIGDLIMSFLCKCFNLKVRVRFCACSIIRGGLCFSLPLIVH